MKYSILSLPLLAVLAACGGGTEVSEEPTENNKGGEETQEGLAQATSLSVANGTGTIVVDGTTYTLSSNTNINGAKIGSGFVMFEGTDYAVAAVRVDEEEYSGLSGDLVMPTASAQYTGKATLHDYNSSNITLTATLSNDPTISGTSGDNRFVVDGSINDDGSVTGTVSYNGSSADMNGGFYGTDAASVGMGFGNDQFLGVITADK